MAVTTITDRYQARLTRTYTERGADLIRQDVEAIEDLSNVFNDVDNTFTDVGDKTRYVASLESEKTQVINQQALSNAAYDEQIQFLQDQIDEINAL